MYTTQKTAIGKLRGYERELTALYAEALLRRRMDEAEALHARRHGVRRAILQWQEWHVDGAPATELPRHVAPLEPAENVARAPQRRTSQQRAA